MNFGHKNDCDQWLMHTEGYEKTCPLHTVSLKLHFCSDSADFEFIAT